MCDFSKYGGPSAEWLAVAADEPPAPTGLTPLEMRAASNAMRDASSAALLPALAGQVALIDVAIPARDGTTLEGRLYWPASVPRDDARVRPALYMHLHGGGWLFGTLASEDTLCAALALRVSAAGAGAASTPLVVLNLNYRHTPEHTFPTAWHDTQDALAWIHAAGAPQFGLDPARVVVGGISAGGHLSASLAIEQHLGHLGPAVDDGLPPLAGQVLMIPALVHADCYAPQLAKLASPAVSSVRENEFAPILPMAAMHMFTDLQWPADKVPASGIDPRDTLISPGNALPAQVRGLPPTVFGICGLDPLRDEGLLYAKMLAEEGYVLGDTESTTRH